MLRLSTSSSDTPWATSPSSEGCRAASSLHGFGRAQRRRAGVSPACYGAERRLCLPELPLVPETIAAEKVQFLCELVAPPGAPWLREGPSWPARVSHRSTTYFFSSSLLLAAAAAWRADFLTPTVRPCLSGRAGPLSSHLESETVPDAPPALDGLLSVRVASC